MAWLFLDTHQGGLVRFGLLTAGQRARITQHASRSHRLLNDLAAKWRSWAPKLEGICVVSGPGSFSAVRIGVLQANLLSRLLHLPLVGVTVEEADALDRLTDRLHDGSFKHAAYVAPVYDAEPNITTPKHA